MQYIGSNIRFIFTKIKELLNSHNTDNSAHSELFKSWKRLRNPNNADIADALAATYKNGIGDVLVEVKDDTTFALEDIKLFFRPASFKLISANESYYEGIYITMDGTQGRYVAKTFADSEIMTPEGPTTISTPSELVLYPAASDAVLYTPQTLTEEQQAQARTNIGAFPAAVVPYFYKTGFVGVQYDARNAPAFSIIQEAGEDWKNKGRPPYTTIKEIEFPCIKTGSYMSFPGVVDFHLLDAAGVLWHCGIYVGGASMTIHYLTKVNASIVIHGTIDADDNTIIRLNEQESQYILTQHRQVEIEFLAGQSKLRLVPFAISNDSMNFFGCRPGVFFWGIWDPNESDVIRIYPFSLGQVPLQPILRTWTDEQESI